MPNGDLAVVEISKLRDYCLDPSHPRGRHKARVFLSALGVGRADANVLRDALLAAARIQPAVSTGIDEYGQRYALDFVFTHGEQTARIRSSWIVRRGETHPRLTTCFVLLS